MRSGLDVAARMKTCCHSKKRYLGFMNHIQVGQHSSTVVNNGHQRKKLEVIMFLYGPWSFNTHRMLVFSIKASNNNKL